jgi:outer membrane protein OmpA-like peptidoglycan-associated protein
MKTIAISRKLFPPRNLFPGQLALILLASAIAIPALAQQEQSATLAADSSSQVEPSAASPESTPSGAVDQRPSPVVSPSSSASTPKEGFWGRMNPFARKKWVNNRVDPLKGQLNELDEVNAKNGRDIQDVDRRSQAGIRQAQSAADAANQTATAAGSQARNANGMAQGASARVDRLNSTVTGLDQYQQANEVKIAFRGGQPALSAAARKQLDGFAASLTGRQGYVLEIEGHSPAAGAAGIQNSGRLADAVKRYLVTQHEIPVYRLHSVALGNAPLADAEGSRRTKTSSVRIRLMENSLAAREAASPHDAASLTGAERP